MLNRNQHALARSQDALFHRIVRIKNIWVFIGIGLAGSLALELLLWDGIFDSLSDFLIGTVWAFSIWVTQWLGNAYLVYRLDKNISWSRNPVRRALIGVLILIAYSASAYILLQTIWHLIIQGGLPENFGLWVLSSSRIAIIISFSISFVLTTIGFFKSWQSSTLEAERLRTEMMTYKYESLRTQINPHFLFNNLNVLKELVYDDQKMAVNFIGRMSDLYRYVLENSDKEAVSLSNELTFLESYIFLLKTRFEDNLDIHLDLDGDTGELVVPMALQLLIENAVKHNEVSSAKPLEVFITKKNGWISVSNNLQPKKTVPDSSKKGLKNLSQRYEFFTSKGIRIKEEPDTYEVHIPILNEAD